MTVTVSYDFIQAFNAYTTTCRLGDT